MLDLAQKGMSMVVVSHEMGFVKAAAARIIFLDEARIVEKATLKEVFANPKHRRTHEFLGHILM